MLWMDEILHQIETKVETFYLFVCIGEASFQSFLGGAKWISQPSSVFGGVFFEGTLFFEGTPFFVGF